MNRIHEDMCLVDDEMLQEIYARILASESASPGSISLRTLGVLRYLDRRTAEAFALVQKVLFDSYIPRQRRDAGHILKEVGLD